MEKNIPIPDPFQSAIASASQTRFGEQDRPYAPHIYRFFITTTSPDIPLQTVLDFAQSYCHRCPRSEAEYNEALKNPPDFNTQMRIIASGRYNLRRNEVDATLYNYTVTVDYID